MKNIKVEIVAPVHNRRKLTLQCLKSLSRVERAGLEIHVVIVDDGSTDGTADAIRQNFPEVEIIRGNGNLWYTAGTNLGVETALKRQPDYVLCINDDSIFDGKCLLKLIECAEKYPRSVVGALLLLWETPHKVFQVSPKWDMWKGGWRHWQEQTIWTIPKTVWEVEMIVGNCVLYPAKVFREVGLMDADKSAQYGDAEFTTRIRKKGWQLLIEPQARVFCQPNYAPLKVSKLPLRKKIDLLFFKRNHSRNLIHYFQYYVSSAPSKLQGFAAYWIFFFRWFLQKMKIGSSAAKQSEKKLAEIFANSVVKDKG